MAQHYSVAYIAAAAACSCHRSGRSNPGHRCRDGWLVATPDGQLWHEATREGVELRARRWFADHLEWRGDTTAEGFWGADK